MQNIFPIEKRQFVKPNTDETLPHIFLVLCFKEEKKKSVFQLNIA